MVAQYPNVSRAEWSAMIRQSDALQAHARELEMSGDKRGAQMIWERRIRPIHEHLRAVSNLTPTDGPPPPAVKARS